MVFEIVGDLFLRLPLIRSGGSRQLGRAENRRGERGRRTSTGCTCCGCDVADLGPLVSHLLIEESEDLG